MCWLLRVTGYASGMASGSYSALVAVQIMTSLMHAELLIRQEALVPSIPLNSNGCSRRENPIGWALCIPKLSVCGELCQRRPIG